jgi:hypothetical protein
MIVIHKELRLSFHDRWQHLDAIRIKNQDKTLWPVLHNLGDTYRRGYSNITEMDINFSAPECLVHHLKPEHLVQVRNIIGHAEFDKLIGYFPWDSIDAFMDADCLSQLAHENGVLDARIIAWKE